MDKEKFLEELLKLEGEESITIRTNDDDEYEICDGSCFLNGTEGTYKSELLGNVAYESLRHIGLDMYNYITKELNETIEEVDIF